MKNNPIGIFDSGVGGLTVASAIKQMLPGESIIYFGDTAHLPYGDKSSEAIVNYSRRITTFLLEHDVKVVVVACNTASATAFPELRAEFGDRTLVTDVVNPVVDYICGQKFRKTGVIGTKRTIETGTYTNMVRERCPESGVVSMATPLLVPMIEEGFIFDDISNGIIRRYLSDRRFNGIDALVLGCTHYPIIKNQISKFFNFEIEVVDSARIVSSSLRDLLAQRGLLRDSRERGTDQFYVSDHTNWFEKIAGMFFDNQIELSLANIW